jgi:hypothetical protein
MDPEFVDVRKASQIGELEATDNAVGAKGADAGCGLRSETPRHEEQGTTRTGAKQTSDDLCDARTNGQRFRSRNLEGGN